MFDFVLGQAEAQSADVVVAGAAVQSNYCRQLAAACAKRGIECQLLLRSVRGDCDSEIQGNYLLDLLLGAKVEILEDCPDWQAQGKALRARAEKLERAGRRVYLARVGTEENLGLYAVAWIQAAIELVEQSQQRALRIDQIWLCSSDTTQAGLALALKHLGHPAKLVGIPAVLSPVGNADADFPHTMATIANQAAGLLGLKCRLSPGDFNSLSGYAEPGYGMVSDADREAMQCAARFESLVLDPVYTGKAFAALLDHIRRKLIPRDHTVIFIHTGGIPALFAYASQLGLR
jgi:1-aminocyclopropane-1-carboxylate deaminase/D-cysteine desulfhydrase-like pyridoxal-dependent ACC family enzyme